MKPVIAILALVMLGSWPSGGRAAPSDNCGFAYADDFATNNVEADSYAHSSIYSQFCLNCLTGWLMFVTDSTGNRGLGFYPGQSYGSMRAFVAYGFPQDGGAGGMVGTLELDALPTVGAAGGWGFAWADVSIKYDDVLASTVRINQAGHYSLDLASPPTTAKVYLYVTGEVFRLDNLSVCFDVPTPTRATSWGQIRSMYR